MTFAEGITFAREEFLGSIFKCGGVDDDDELNLQRSTLEAVS